MARSCRLPQAARPLLRWRGCWMPFGARACTHRYQAHRSVQEERVLLGCACTLALSGQSSSTLFTSERQPGRP
eukprot:scaffold7625_cov277-Pinguiococcus_pyrenoidosus.AAC.2